MLINFLVTRITLGTRYTFTISNVEGMPEYHKGETEEISGIEVSEDEKTITINL